MFTILGADGKEYGPVTAGKMHEWIAGGRANLQSKARRSGETEWKTLGDFPEFGDFGANSGGGAGTPPPPPAFAASPATPGTPIAVTAPVAAYSGLAPADLGARFLAQLIDGLTSLVAALPGAALLFIGAAGGNGMTPLAIGGGILMCICLVTLLVFQIYLLSTRGQTIGKKLMDIRIVSFDDESNPGFVKAFLLRAFVNGLIGAVPFVGFIYSITDICFIFRDDRRCLHDLLAGTKVVKA